MFDQLTFNKDEVYSIVRQISDAGRVLLKSEKDFLHGKEIQVYVYKDADQADRDTMQMCEKEWKQASTQKCVYVYHEFTLDGEDEDYDKVLLPIRVFEKSIERAFSGSNL